MASLSCEVNIGYSRGTHPGKPSNNIDYDTFLAILGNHVAKAFAETHFGKFEAVTAKRFDQGRFRGNFRILAGSSQTFIHILEYEGPSPFSDAEVFIISPRPP